MSDSEGNHKMQIVSANGKVYSRYELSDDDYPVSVNQYDIEKLRLVPYQWHWHSELEIIYVETGQIEIMADTEDHVCNTGEALLIKGNAMHNVVSAEGSTGSFYSIVFGPELVVGRPGGGLWTKYWVTFMNAPFQAVELKDTTSWQKNALDDIVSAICAIKMHKHGYEFAVRGAICNCAAHLAAHVSMPEGKSEHIDSADEKRIKTALMYIRQHYAETITLDDIAESANISKSECCRCFKRTLHESPFEYLMRYRIYCASRRLCDTSDNDDMPIAELALCSGFNNISYFNKIFKKYMHCTPSVYRRDLHSRSENPESL